MKAKQTLSLDDALQKLIGRAVGKAQKELEKKDISTFGRKPSNRGNGKVGGIGRPVGGAFVVKKTPDEKAMDELEKGFLNPEIITHFYNFIDHCKASGLDLNDAQVLFHFSKRDGTSGPTAEIRKSGFKRVLFQLERKRLIDEEEPAELTAEEDSAE